MRRSLTKHKIAFSTLLVWHFIFFFPTLFMGRVVSPNDVFSNFDPWMTTRPLEVQNAVINDPPTSYYTLMSLVKSRWSAFHWNPFIASGVPGFGSTQSASLTPIILLPALLLPLPWVYGGIIFLKLNVAFFFAYLWLREEGLGKRGAALGAIVFASSGVFAVRWLWQLTNATPLYPAILWIVRRMTTGKRTPVWAVALITLTYALSGFPATMAYGAYVALGYLVVRGAPAARRLSRARPARALAGGILALLVAAPSIVPFIQFVKRSGYLAMRADLSTKLFFPLRHFWLFLQPQRLGSHAYHNWAGDRALSILNNDVESAVYVGVIALPLLLVALFNRRASARWYWLAVLAVCLAAMFGFLPVARVLAALPGIKYSWLTRLQMVTPIPVAYLAAAGLQLIARRRAGVYVAALLAVLASADLAIFAGRFHPYLEPRVADVPSTPTIDFLRSDTRPFRIAPFFVYLWPNTSEYVRLEDVRSHFSSEAKYRRLLTRIDPSAWGTASTILAFNSLNFDFNDPLVSMLGVRYFVEQRNIDIIKWKTFKDTVPGVQGGGVAPVILQPGQSVQRQIAVDAEPFYAIELPATVEATFNRKAHLTITLIKGSRVVHSREWSTSDISVMNKTYVPLRPYARLGESVVVRVEATGLRANLPTAGDGGLFFGRVTTPVIFERELPDGRIFRNSGELPRFFCVSEVRKMTDDEFIGTKGIDFSRTAIVTDAAAPLPAASDATAALKLYGDARQEIVVNAPAPTFLASSEKLTPELGVTIDGREVKPVEINLLFAGVPVPAGTHTVVFTRRIGRGWWPVSGAALVLLVTLSVADFRRARPR